MKRFNPLFAVLLAFILSVSPNDSHAQIIDIIQEAIRQALIAADVAVQKVQNTTIGLQNVQKALENQLSKLSLGDISAWEQKQKDLYSEYFDELWKVKTVIAYFRQITGIIAQQKALVAEYRQSYNRIKNDKNFSPSELNYIYSVYSGIISESIKSVDQIISILTAFSLQMTDASRLKIISQASADIEQQTVDLRSFNNRTIQTSFQRAKTLAEVSTLKKLYGLAQ
jgi:hypothetical protein